MRTENNDLKLEKKQARIIEQMTFELEKFCRFKESFFAEKFNLTPLEFRCLRFINDNNTVSSKMIANYMGLTPGRITQFLNSLDNKKLLKRTIEKNDRRIINITLTAKAKSFLDNAINEYIKLHQDILQFIPKEKREQILDSMIIFFESLKTWSAQKEN